MNCPEWGGLGHRFRPYSGPGGELECKCGARPAPPPFPGFAEPVARARRTDPETSHAAAASVRNIRETQRVVLEELRRIGPTTHEVLVAHMATLPGYWTPSGVRTRCSELVAAGLIEPVGQTVVKSGRRATIWAAREETKA